MGNCAITKGCTGEVRNNIAATGTGNSAAAALTDMETAIAAAFKKQFNLNCNGACPKPGSCRANVYYIKLVNNKEVTEADGKWIEPTPNVNPTDNTKWEVAWNERVAVRCECSAKQKNPPAAPKAGGAVVPPKKEGDTPAPKKAGDTPPPDK
jgi:hypothetical protein